MKTLTWWMAAVFALGATAFGGTGTEADPYTIAEARALAVGTTEYWAQGYIVGGRYDDFETPCQYDYAVSCADSASETVFDNCLQVLLQTDGGREAWGLASNPGNVGKQIKFKGYRDVYGVGSPPSFEGVDNADISEVLQENQPPVIGAVGSKSVIESNTLTFTVTATDPADGDEIELVATALPAGATFTGATNAGTATGTFTWENAGPLGDYSATFQATDKDGSDTETVSINVHDGSGPLYIAFQGFEGTANDTWGITAANYVESTTGTGDTPANQRIRTGSYSWQPRNETESSTSETLELDAVDVSTYSDMVIELHVSTTSTDTNDFGMYPEDTMSFVVALDGEDFGVADLMLTGNEEEGGGYVGVLWPMDATGIATTTAGVSRTVTPASGGIVADGPATVQIHVPDGTASVKFKATASLPYVDYYWNIDDISLTGVNDGGASNLPPAIAIVPNDTSLSVAVSNEISFVITGTEIPNDAADQITLRATGLPAGASFPEVSGTSVLTNTFSWTPTATGTTVVSFFAEDKDGTNQIDVTIQVYEQQPVGTYRAVICGISDYDGDENDLNYCDDDAQELYDLLLSGSNWEASNMQLLLDSQATEANIQAAIASMGAASQPGDVCLFFFSGHGGGDMPDTDGDEGGDGFDEYFCPYYIYDNEVTDDELSDWLDALPTDNIIVLMDTCFSGGHLKAPAGVTYKGISRTGAVVTDRSNGFMDDLRRRTKKDVDDLISPYISTACDEEELSGEYGELQNGLYAYYLLEALTNADANADGWFAGEEAFAYLDPLVVAYDSSQHPQEYDGWNGLANIVTWEPQTDQPPRITLDPAGTNKTVVFDNALSFTVTATDADGLEVALSAGGMPEGAVFAGATNTGTASAAFNWTPGEAQVGSYTVTFSATDDDGTTQTGVKITVRDGSLAADLFISEYVEGSSNNKYIEIFNGTGASVDLTEYSLRLYANGATSPNNDVALSGSLADGAVIVYQNSSATAYAGTAVESAACNFNGNDAVALAKNGADIDVVGTIGDETVFAAEVTKVRKNTVAQGTTTYDPLEWDDYPQDTVEYLGSHEFGAAGPEAPSFAAIPPQSASVGVLFSLDVSVYDSGNPAPAVTLESSTADAGDYSFAGGMLSFTPSTAGAFDFVFLASNELGTAMATATVTAVEGPVELLAPVIQAASGIDATQFNANWQASAGATGYILDVATNETFSGGGEPPVGGNLMSNAGFETGDSTDWDKFETEYAVVSTDPQEGSYHVNCAATGTRDLMQAVDITGDGVTEYEVSFWYKKPSEAGNSRIWATWATGGQVSGDNLTPSNYLASVSDWTQATYHVVPQSGVNTLNFEVRTYTGATVSWDNFYVGPSSRGAKAAPYVPGYESLDVGNVTTHAVTGLTEGVTYYYRVKAYNASSNSPYSAVTSVVTQASSGDQPDIDAFEVPAGATASATLATTTVGKTYKLQYTTDLTTQPEPIWTDADTEPGTGGGITLEDGDPADVARYYRVTMN